MNWSIIWNCDNFQNTFKCLYEKCTFYNYAMLRYKYMISENWINENDSRCRVFIYWCNLFPSRYRAIIYPLRSKPSKLLSFSVIAVVWIASLIFAMPMGAVYVFDYHEENYWSESKWRTNLKPFCSIDFKTNTTLISESSFRYYR